MVLIYLVQYQTSLAFPKILNTKDTFNIKLKKQLFNNLVYYIFIVINKGMRRGEMLGGNGSY